MGDHEILKAMSGEHPHDPVTSRCSARGARDAPVDAVGAERCLVGFGVGGEGDWRGDVGRGIRLGISQRDIREYTSAGSKGCQKSIIGVSATGSEIVYLHVMKDG